MLSRTKFSYTVVTDSIGIIIAISGLLVLLGWQLNVSSLKTFGLGTVPMKPNLGVLFFLGGIVLVLLQSDHSLVKPISKFLSVLIILISLLTFIEFVFPMDLGIDGILYQVKDTTVFLPNPGRMAANAALNFILLGLVFYHLSVRKKLNLNFIDVCIVVVFTISTLGLISFIFGYNPIDDTTGYARLAVNATVLFIILSLGIFITVRQHNKERFTLEQKLLAGITIFAVMIVFISILSISNIKSWQKVVDQRQHTQIVKDAISNIRKDLADVETGVGGYFLTGDVAYLSQIAKAKDDVRRVLNNLRSYTSGYPFQDNKLEYLRLLVEKQIKIAGQLIEPGKTKGFDKTITSSNYGKINVVSDSTRGMLDKIMKEENRQVKIQDSVLNDHSAQVGILTKIGLLLLAILLVLHYVFIKGDVTERKKAEKALLKLNEELEDRVKRRSESLRQSREQYRLMIESVKDYAIFMLDAEGRIVNWNSGGERIYGYHAGEIIGQHFSKFFTPDDVHAGKPLLDLQTATTEGRSEEERFKVRKDGSQFWANSVIVTVTDKSGKLTGFSKVTRDITERKKAEEKIHNMNIDLEKQVARRTELLSEVNKKLQEEEERSRLVVESAPNAIIMVNSKGIIQMVNRQTENYFGYHRDELVGSSVDMLVPHSGKNSYASHLLNFMANPSTRYMGKGYDLFGVRKDGSEIPIEVALSPISINHEMMILASIIDITERKEMEQQKQLFNNILENSLNEIFIFDSKTLKFILVSQGAMKNLGYTQNELNEMTPVDIKPQITLKKFNELINPLLTGESEYIEFYTVHRRKDGSIYPVEIHISISAGKQFLIALIMDITKRKQAEQQLIIQSAALDAAANAIILTDNKGYINWVNPAFTKLTGYPPEDVIGKKTNLLKSDKHSVTFYKNLWDTILSGNVWHGETINRKKDGTEYTEEQVITPVRDETGKIAHFIAIKEDITERKRIEDEIIRARNEAEQASLAKSEFLSRMSHELRTPMNSILGFAQLMDMGELAPAHKKEVGHIIKNGKHLLDLINEVLDLSRIEAGRLSISLEPIHLSGIVSETLDIVRPLADQHKIELEFDGSSINNLYVKADQQKLKQVLLNLINNAVKYNREGGLVRIVCEVAGSQHLKVSSGKSKVDSGQSTAGKGQSADEMLKTVKINIIDTGKGIAPKDIKNLFNPFQRIDADISGIEGTGLGLTVAKKLIEAMHGIIGVESKPGTGSTFWIELPQAESQMEHYERLNTMPENKPEKAGIDGILLYIEDNISNIQVVEQIIETYRPSVSLVSNMFGKNTVKFAQDYKPALILLDLDLPDIIGSEVLQLLQENEETKSIPVVILSADAMPKQIEKLMKTGAKNYLTKPLNVVEFLKVLDEFMNNLTHKND